MLAPPGPAAELHAARKKTRPLLFVDQLRHMRRNPQDTLLYCPPKVHGQAAELSSHFVDFEEFRPIRNDYWRKPVMRSCKPEGRRTSFGIVWFFLLQPAR